MNKRLLILLLISTSLFSSLVAVVAADPVVPAAPKVPDGYWNSKPWDRAVLDKGVRAGDKDALAEWAYGVIYALPGFNLESKLLVKRARAASEQGSLLGKHVLGICYRVYELEPDSRARGLELLKEAAEGGHPLARWRLADFLITGTYVEQDTTDGLKKLEQSLKDGVWVANFTLATVYESGALGEVDFEKAAELHTKLFTDYAYPHSAHKIFSSDYTNSQDTTLSEHFTSEVVEKAHAYVKDRAERNDFFCQHLFLTKVLARDNPNLAIPELIKQANPSETDFPRTGGHTLASLSDGVYGHMYNRKDGCRTICCNRKTLGLMARESYRLGSTNSVMTYRAAEGGLRHTGKDKIEPEDEKEAVELLRQLIRDDEQSVRAHQILAEYFTVKYTHYTNGTQEDFDRGMAHFIHLSQNSLAAQWIASFYCKCKKVKDVPKGIAAATWAVEISSGAAEKKAKRWIAQTKRAITPAQRKEVDRLIEEGYPHAEKFRKEAFLYLQKAGDIPADHKFKVPPKKEVPVEEVSIPRTFKRFINLASLVLMLPEAAPPALFSTEENKLMGKYLAGEKLSKEELEAWVLLLVSSDEKLKALLAVHAVGESSELSTRAKELSNVIGTEHDIGMEDTPLQASVGWYLIYEGDRLVSTPYICKLVEGGAAAKAKLKLGDVIYTCQGQSLKGTYSRNLFMRVLAFWPSESPLELEIQRARFLPRQTAYDTCDKDVKKTLSVRMAEKSQE